MDASIRLQSRPGRWYGHSTDTKAALLKGYHGDPRQYWLTPRQPYLLILKVITNTNLVSTPI